MVDDLRCFMLNGQNYCFPSPGILCKLDVYMYKTLNFVDSELSKVKRMSFHLSILLPFLLHPPHCELMNDAAFVWTNI